MITSQNQTPILVIEDSLDDLRVMKRAFRQAGLKNRLLHFQKAEQALDYLLQRGDYADSDPALPGIILLDLNLPGMDGVEMLTVLKADTDLHAIPVVVFTTSDDQRDIVRCYDAGANSYVRKPVDLSGYVQVVSTWKQYWLDVSMLPPAQRPDGRRN